MSDGKKRMAYGCLVASLLFCAAGWGVGLYRNWDAVRAKLGLGGGASAGAQAATAMASELPQSTVGAFVVREPDETIEAMKAADERLEKGGLEDSDFAEDFYETKERGEERLGFDITEVDEWKSTGLDLGAPMLAGMFSEDDGETEGVAVLAQVAEKSKLEEFLVDLSDADEIESETVSGHEIHALEDEYLAYDGDRAYLLLATSSDMDEPKKRLAQLVESPKSGEALTDLEGYEAFEEALLSKEMFAAFFNPEAPAAEMAFDEIKEDLPTDALGMKDFETFQKRLSGAGFGTTVDPEDLSVRYRMWAGLDSKGREAIENLLAPEKTIAWENFATKETTGALRLSIRPDAVWEQSKESLGEKSEQTVDMASKQLSARAGTELDVEKDVIQALSGDVGLVVYDISNIFGPEGEFRWGGLLSMKWIGLLQFKEKSDLDNLLEKAKEALDNQELGTNPKLRNLKTNEGKEVEGIRVLDLGNPMFPKVYAKDALLAVAPSSIGEGAMRAYLEGERSGGSLAEAENVKLGGKFAKEKYLNGLYVNLARVEESIGESLSAKGEVREFLEIWRELAITAYVNDQGLYFDVEARVSEASGDESGDEK